MICYICPGSWVPPSSHTHGHGIPPTPLWVWVGVGGSYVCSVFMVSTLPCGVGLGVKRVVFAVWGIYNSWCIQMSGT